MTTRNELAEQRAEQLPAADWKLYEAFRGMGMAPAAALGATRGRDSLPSTDPVEELAEGFEQLGTSRAAARTAAMGRDTTEHELREILSRGVAPPAFDTSDSPGPLTRDEQNLRDSLTQEEQVYLAEAAEEIVDQNELGRTYGCDARDVAERWLLKAVHRRQEGQRR